MQAAQDNSHTQCGLKTPIFDRYDRSCPKGCLIQTTIHQVDTLQTLRARSLRSVRQG